MARTAERARLRPGRNGASQTAPAVRYCQDVYNAAEGADAVLIATEWEQFRAQDLARLKRVMARPVIVDLRNNSLPLPGSG